MWPVATLPKPLAKSAPAGSVEAGPTEFGSFPDFFSNCLNFLNDFSFEHAVFDDILNNGGAWPLYIERCATPAKNSSQAIFYRPGTLRHATLVSRI